MNNHLPEKTILNHRYQVIKKISSGGYGIIYLALDRFIPNTFYAIKEFLPITFKCREHSQPKVTEEFNQYPLQFGNESERDQFETMRQTFHDETKVVMSINHPNIIQIVDMFEENNTSYFVMPYEKGLSLFSFIYFFSLNGGNYSFQKKYSIIKKIPDITIKKILLDICYGVQHLHENGLMHLDIKPGNIWVRPNGDVVILDLGSARPFKGYRNLSHPASTAFYAAPEMYTPIRQAQWDERTDIYSIGGVLRFCLDPWFFYQKDVKPSFFEKINPFKRLFALQHLSEIERVQGLNEFVPPLDDDIFNERLGQINSDLLFIQSKCTNQNPDERYKNVGELIRDLESIQDNFLDDGEEKQHHLDAVVILFNG